VQVNAPGNISEFFNQNVVDDRYGPLSVFITRPDGHIIFKRTSGAQKSDSSIGALIAGLWQASQALSSIISKNDDSFSYRLSYDTSSNGVYVLPISHGQELYCVGVVFNQVVNPGALKNYLRDLQARLQRYLESRPTIRDKAQVFSKEENEKFLFNDLTDAEVDQLFNF